MTISRRTFSSMFALFSCNPAELTGYDIPTGEQKLVGYGRQFDKITKALDHSDITSSDFENAVDALDSIAKDICDAKATTMEGLTIKAKAACWARLGDLELPSDAPMDEIMAYSIVRDLIRLYAPELETPDAWDALQRMFH